ncbi:MAG TPA: GNAT family N-acetyltransferase [Hyphomonadaceae bacterium]|nr:GNAT family N-acetyltransferase [Hyphomonadaceae bacterium]
MSTLPTFRYAMQNDVPALVALIERAYRGPETAGSWMSEAHLLKGPRTSHHDIATLIAQPDSRFLIAELEGQLAGCCLLQKTKAVDGASKHDGTSADASAYFGMFAINPSIHSSGLGKTVLAEAERRVRELWNAQAMVMTVINVREALIEYYKRRGYTLTGARHPFPFNESTGEVTRDFDLVEMRKILGAHAS